MNIIARRLKMSDVESNTMTEACKNFLLHHSYDIKENLKNLITNHERLHNKTSKELSIDRLVIDSLLNYVDDHEEDYLDELVALGVSPDDAKESFYGDGVNMFSNNEIIAQFIKELKGE